MYDYSLLRGKITQMHGNQRAFAKSVGWDEARVSRILNNKSDMTRAEIELWSNDLAIEPSDIASYFFAHSVCANAN